MKKIIFLSTSFLLIFSFLLVDVKEASACSYIAQTPAEKFAEADVVFLGKVISAETLITANEPSTGGSVVNMFDVSKVWKGDSALFASAPVYSPFTAGTSCLPFRGQVDIEYVVYADMDATGNLTTTEVGPVESDYASEDLKFLGAGKTMEMYLDQYMVKYSFSKNLSLGMKGSEVLSLQKYLNSRGFKVAIVGPGSPGSETSYFGPATKSALIKFQLAKSITPAVGFFGPITRAVVNAN